MDVKKQMEVGRKTKAGMALTAQSYEAFKTIVENENNISDFFVDLEQQVATKLQAGKDIKAVVDEVARQLKKQQETARGYLTRYMEEEGIKKIEGERSKSITLQEEKVIEGVYAIRQIKVGAKYIDLKDLSVEDLVKMLEEKGIKTRERTEKRTAVTKASIRVQK